VAVSVFQYLAALAEAILVPECGAWEKDHGFPRLASPPIPDRPTYSQNLTLSRRPENKFTPFP
jgi:hypothetical protein